MWKGENKTLTRTFKFKNFNQAFSYMTQVAIEAGKLKDPPQCGWAAAGGAAPDIRHVQRGWIMAAFQF